MLPFQIKTHSLFNPKQLIALYAAAEKSLPMNIKAFSFQVINYLCHENFNGKNHHALICIMSAHKFIKSRLYFKL